MSTVQTAALCIPLSLFIGCGSSSPSVSSQESPVEPHVAAITSVMDASIAIPAIPTVQLSLNKPVFLTSNVLVEVELTQYTIEEIAAAPGDEESYPAGSGVMMSISIGGYSIDFSDLSEGYDSVLVAWTPQFKVTIVSHNTGELTAVVQIEKITDTIEKQLHQAARLEEKRPLPLDPPYQVRFGGHGHKSVYAGQQSPLVVNMVYLSGDQTLENGSYNLFPPDDNTWVWRNYRFEISEYEYDRFMILQVSRFELKPMEAKKEAQ